MRANIFCKHYRKHDAEAVYELIGTSIWLCSKCKKKLIKQVLAEVEKK